MPHLCVLELLKYSLTIARVALKRGALLLLVVSFPHFVFAGAKEKEKTMSAFVEINLFAEKTNPSPTC